MNIFALDYNPEMAALCHNDRHCVKQILEGVQLLNNYFFLSNKGKFYKPTHLKHPCTLWLLESEYNGSWLYDMLYHLNEQYKFRFNHIEDHVSLLKLNAYMNSISYKFPTLLRNSITNIPIGITPFKKCMPDECRNYDEDPVVCYRYYYITHKHIDKNGKPMNIWNKGNSSPPSWYSLNEKEHLMLS